MLTTILITSLVQITLVVIGVSVAILAVRRQSRMLDYLGAVESDTREIKKTEEAFFAHRAPDREYTWSHEKGEDEKN